MLAPWFLAGFAALVPLVLVHLRRQRREVGVASLLLWRDLPGVSPPRRRRARIVLPAALALQALLLVLAVVALAALQLGGGTPSAGAAPFVAVVDGSTRMAMTDVAPNRLAAARDALSRELAGLPDGTPVSVVVAGTALRLLASRVTPAAARDVLDEVRPDAPSADLAAGLRLAAGELHRSGGTIAVEHAEGTPMPAVRASGVRVDTGTVGRQADNQSLVAPVARCAGDACSVLVGVRNEAAQAVREALIVERDGQRIGARTLTVRSGGEADAVITAQPGSRLTLRLDRPDALPDDNRATVTVPDPRAPLTAAVVSGDGASPVARALAAVPAVRVRRVAPGAPIGDAGLVVFDRVRPTAVTPPSLVIAPPSLPGGRVGAPVADPSPSGAIPGATLLDGVDLGGLVVAPGGVRHVQLPAALSAIAWAPGAVLLADDGRTTLLTIDPARSNLAQLPAFPILLANIADRARGLAPESPPPSQPGLVTLRATDGGPPAPDHPTDLWPWLIAAALLVLVAETALAAEWRVRPAQRDQVATRRGGSPR